MTAIIFPSRTIIWAEMIGAFVLNIGFDKLQHIYDKHAPDFGHSGPKNKTQLQALDKELKKEVADSATQHIQGQNRGQLATTMLRNSRTR